MGRTTALAFFCCALLSAPASAVVSLTYVFDVAGTGLSTGMVTGLPPGPPVFYSTPFGGARIVFVVPEATGKSIFFAGSSVLYSGSEGLNFSFNDSPGFGALSGTGGVCFSNSTGLLPVGPVTLTAGSGCGAVNYKYTAAGTDTFSGNVVNFSVLSGNPFGLATPYAVIKTNVPEPATWAMMIVGFGAIGYGLRARRKVAVRSA